MVESAYLTFWLEKDNWTSSLARLGFSNDSNDVLFASCLLFGEREESTCSKEYCIIIIYRYLIFVTTPTANSHKNSHI